jgi:hypothetical protein
VLLALLDVAVRHVVAAQGRGLAVARLASEIDVEREYALAEAGL